uniref:Variant surface glycoprotein n=1 Tax=Trypanosoma brucei TaxID=5691 RepID=A0A1V0FYL3_9TRYP|nr:variant surface glycoprotein [Trypanosoma brucei]
MYKMRYTANIVMMVATAEFWLNAEAAEATNAKCTTACGCGNRLNRRLKLYTDAYGTAKSNHADNLKAFTKLLAASSTSNDKQLLRRLAPIISAAGKIITACEHELSKASDSVAEATAAVASAAARYKLIHDVKKTTTGFTFGMGGTTTQTSASFTDNTLGVVKPEVCEPGKDGEQAISINSQTEAAEPEPQALATQTYFRAKCSRNGDNSNSCHSGGGLSANGVVKVQIQYGEAEADDKTAFDTDTATIRTIQSTPSDFLDGAHIRAHQKLEKIRTGVDFRKCDPKLDDYNALAEQPSFQLVAYKALTGNWLKEKLEGSAIAETTTALTEHYGKTGDQFNKNVWKAVQDTTAPRTDTNKEKREKIEKLNSMEDLSDAISRQIVNKLAQQEEEENKNAKKVDTTTENECSTKKGDACKGDCVLEDGVCKTKKKGEGENKEKEGKYEKPDCSKLTTQPECEKANDGQTTKVCGWRSGKDNEDEKDKVKCRNGSFLLNKKFALSVVSAAFVALLF